jgi:multidrug efflux pump subunit AcrA (membrane-fusion protein)
LVVTGYLSQSDFSSAFVPTQGIRPNVQSGNRDCLATRAATRNRIHEIQILSVCPAAGRLIDGQLVRVDLGGGAPTEKVVIPQRALLADQEGTYVFVVEGGKAAIRRVKPGGESGTNATGTRLRGWHVRLELGNVEFSGGKF